MKKNIKLSAKQSQLVVDQMNAFKSDIFKLVSPELEHIGGALAAPFSKAFVQGGWTRHA